MRVEFQKQHFETKAEHFLLSNHFLCHLVLCVSVKLVKFVKWSFLVITNKSAKIYLNIFGDTVIQSMKSGKTRKSGFDPMSRQKKLASLFPARLET